MKTGLISLFVILIVILAGCVFGCPRLTSNNKPICPDWATSAYGQRCESTSKSITPDDLVPLVDWQIGRIQLNNSHIDNVYGVEFFKSDGSQIDPKDMDQGVFYSFRKTTATAVFHIWPNSDYKKGLTPDTHVNLAKP
jgi:hypothetical protein